MDWFVSPHSLPHLYIEILIPNVIEFGDRAYKELIKVKWNKGRTLVQQKYYSWEETTKELFRKGKNSDQSLITLVPWSQDFQLSELWRNKSVV